MAYDKEKDKDRNYQAEINDAVANGDYASASRLEQDRNEKIKVENLSYAQTNNYAMPKGASDSTYNGLMQNKNFTPSATVQSWDSASSQAYGNLSSLTNGKNSIVSSSVKGAINSQFVVSQAVREADAYLKQQLEKIQSGRTSYTDEIEAMMGKISSRDKFSYDVDSDPLFQQALSSAMNSGKQAMQDTIGQASALTGGYGSTYATSAGNQAYNAFIEDAYDNLPQYYQMAMEAYQMEGDEMYRQLGMYTDADEREYGRNVTAYDTTSQYRNRMYDEEFALWRASKEDAFATADLQISEHNQKVNDAYTLYTAASDQYDKAYEREYNSWKDTIDMLYKDLEIENNDYWNQANMDFEASENQKQRDWQSNESAIEREWKSNESVLDREHDVNITNINNAHQSSENALDRAHDSSESALDRAHDSSENQKQREWQTEENQKDRDLTTSEGDKDRAVKLSSGSGNDIELNGTQWSTALEVWNKTPGDDSDKYKAVVDTLAVYGVTIDPSNQEVLMDALDSNKAPEVTKGTISQFRTNKGDNFNIKLGDKYYAVENKGQVKDSETLKGLKGINVNNGDAFLYNGDIYVKYADGYFEVGSMMFGGQYNELVKDLQK